MNCETKSTSETVDKHQTRRQRALISYSMETCRAFVVGSEETGANAEKVWFRRIEERTMDCPDAGDVLIKVHRSGINYKDGLASTAAGKIARINPMIPGIDLAGEVVQSNDPGFTVGQMVLAHGYDIGVAHNGGFAGYARIPSKWLMHLPALLTPEQAMLIGTAGFTSAMSVAALEHRGLTPDSGPVLVTGATGGVGSVAVGMLARRGYNVVASTGKPDAAQWLLDLGATSVIDRAELTVESKRPLEAEKYAGAIDCVGGSTLATVLRQLTYGSSVAASGLTGGGDLPTTVFPFILRGVNLLGIDSVQLPLNQRTAIWNRVATDLRPAQIDKPADQVVGLDDLPEHLDRILAGGVTGRVLVDPWA
jgi:acrylyl-CoA reductase (NADPH)